jgi:hypothetical protein
MLCRVAFVTTDVSEERMASIIRVTRITLMRFFVQVYRGLKSYASLSENVNLRVPPSNLRGFSLFCACPSNKHCPSARCVYGANVAVGKNHDIFALGAVSVKNI